MLLTTPAHLLWIDHLFTAVWTGIALLAVLLVQRRPRGRRGAWRVVATYCVVIVADKLVDLQMLFYAGCHALVDLCEPWLDRSHHRGVVLFGLLVPLTLIAVGGTLWLVRADRAREPGKRMALGGLLLVVVYVGTRLLPGLRDVVGLGVGWVLEAIAAAMVFVGVQRGRRVPAGSPVLPQS